MKIKREKFEGGTGAPAGRGVATRRQKHSEGGMATVIFIALLAIMMILVTAEARALVHLRREVKFLEQQQIKRLNTSQTNATSIVSLTEKPGAK